MKFGAVGGLGFVVDTYVYNLLRTGWWPLNGSEAILHDKPLVSKIISTAVATIVTWLGNRYWTFRHRRRVALQREFVLFGVMNVGGLAIALGCLWFSHYALGLTSALADNISGQGIGLVLGTLFRFWAYRTFVFNGDEPADPAEDAAAPLAPADGPAGPAVDGPDATPAGTPADADARVIAEAEAIAAGEAATGDDAAELATATTGELPPVTG